MKFKQQAVYALLTAILAGVVTYVTQAMGGLGHPGCKEMGNALTFISFCTWACYFVAGCNVKGALNWIWSMFGGAICAALMFILTFAFIGIGYLPAVSIAVIIVVWFMMFPEKVKMNGAAVFIGTAMFFALHAACPSFIDGSIGKYCWVIVAEMIYTAIGLLAGFLTIWFSQITDPLGKDK